MNWHFFFKSSRRKCPEFSVYTFTRSRFKYIKVCAT